MLSAETAEGPMNSRRRKATPAAAAICLFAMAGACGSSSETALGDPVGPTSSGPGGATGSGSSATGGAATGSSSSTTAATSTTTGGTTGAGGSGAGGSMGTGGSTPGGPKVDVPPGDPITAPAMTWTAVPVDGSICRDKQATGFGV